MKKILMGLVLFLFLASCATTRPKVEHKYSNITPEKIRNVCEADNHWRMAMAGVVVVVVRFEECLGVNDMLVMVTTTNQHTKEIRSRSFELLGLHFLEFLKTTNPPKTWALEKLRDFIVDNDGKDLHDEWIVIYKINSKLAACSGGTCKKKQ